MLRTRENSPPWKKSPSKLSNTKRSFLKIAFIYLYQQLKKKRPGAMKRKKEVKWGEGGKWSVMQWCFNFKEVILKERGHEASAVDTVWHTASRSCYDALRDTMDCTYKLWAKTIPFQLTVLSSDILLQPWEKDLTQAGLPTWQKEG